MARRPSAPRPRPTSRRPPPSPTTTPRRGPSGAPARRAGQRTPDAPLPPARPRSALSSASASTASSAPSAVPTDSGASAHSADSARSALSAASPAPAPRPRSRTVGRPRSASTPEAETTESTGRVVQAAGRFRELVAGRPWRRRRRAIIAGIVITALVLVAALVAAIFLPALQIREVTVAGTGYVQEEDVRSAVAPHTGSSVLLLPTGAIVEDVAEVPGVESAEVERNWPDGARVTITEAAPIAVLTRTDGTTAVIGADGQELPPAAGEREGLVPLTVESGSADPEEAASAMSAVLAAMPDSLRAAIQEVTASSTSDVTIELALEDGGTKTVVWGDAHDAELKAEVVQTLLGWPGTVIDVSSPIAPVTR